MQPQILFDFAIKVKSWVKKREQIVNNLSVIQEIRWFFIVATIFKWIGCASKKYIKQKDYWNNCESCVWLELMEARITNQVITIIDVTPR